LRAFSFDLSAQVSHRLVMKVRPQNSLSSNALGAIFMMLSMAGFVLNDTMVKLVAGDLSLFQAILVRGVFASCFMALLCAFMGAFRVPGGIAKALLHPTVLLRTIGEAGGTYFFLSALFQMPIANVTAVLQILPLTITLAAALFLGETVGWKRYGAIIAGFVGVLLIVKPGTDGFNGYAIYAVISTGFITLRDLVTRKMPKTIPSLLVSLVTACAITVMGAIGSLFEPWQEVTSFHLGVLSGAAAILMVGYIFSILAMRDGEVSFVSPFRYSILIWALFIGYLVFGDLPDIVSVIGAVIVVASGLFTFYRERLLARKSATS
jgi:drug/metabolite transporter (DMT)-like permease